MDTRNLPNSAELLTSIINQLSTIEPPSLAVKQADPEPAQPDFTERRPNSRENLNPLSSLTPDALSKAKSLLITLHCLFPNELLLALDILDKKLVTKCSVHVSYPGGSDVSVPRTNDVYFVRSQSTLPGDAIESSARSYEVHLQSWNCTCDAFMLASVKAMDYNDRHKQDDDDRNCDEERRIQDWHFGGTLTTQRSAMGPPAICCKHLLACVLVARCPNLFAQSTKELLVELEESTVATGMNDDRQGRCELAGWCAG